MFSHLSSFMKPQLKFFDGRDNDAVLNLPDGMRYGKELISVADENALVARIRKLPFKEFEFHGFKGKRRTVSFGWQYEFSGRGALRKADDIPEFLLPLRAAAANFVQIEPTSLEHVLVIEYGSGAGIGWHRDRPVFGEVIGVSLLAPCVMRFRKKLTKSAWVSPHAPATWERINLLAEPRSAYHLTGAARFEWEHSILRVDELRYSITFRSLLPQ